MEGMCCLLIEAVGVLACGTTNVVPIPIVAALQVVSTEDSLRDETFVVTDARFDEATLCDYI